MKKWIVMLFVLLAGAVMAACNKEPQPEERFAAYVDEWNGQHFDKMYDYLSADAKEKVSKEDFTNRYKKIYEDLEIKNVKVTFTPPEEVEEKDGKVQFPFSVKMESIAGKIAFDHKAVLTKEERDDEKNWYVNWDTTFIFPELKEGDKISLAMTPAKRGDIVDKNGIGLAVTGKVSEVGIIPGKMEGKEEEIIKKVADLLKMAPEQIEKELSASWVQPEHFVPLKKIPGDDTKLLEKVTSIPSVDNRSVEARVYPLGEAAAHLIGYVGPITAEELEKAGSGYRTTDVIGKRGLEQVFEKRLKGENGVQIVIKKEDGSEVVLGEKPVKDGEDVQLTIDAGLQKSVYNELKDEAGTAAALHPLTGETLALVSSPSFDPNVLSLGASKKEWKALQENDKEPLLTRFKAGFAPGSAMKPVTAAVALEAGAIDWNKTYDINGKSWKKDSSWGGYSVTRVTEVNGPVNLEKALILSDNIYFARAALDLGKDKFADGLQSFGFEEDIPSYAYPLEQSKIGSINSDIALADSAYGQGQIQMNIVHLAASYTPFSNKGNMIQPVLVKGEKAGTVWKEKVMSEQTAADLQKALVKVVEDPKGTARSARIPGYPLAGKTGTAELKAKQGEKGKENGFFVAYNPENPELLVALMVEDVEGRGGSEIAVNKVKKIFEER
ncbi:penicillin-binding transpeptidase domain-containing protein [Siminovitchia sp. 179-K 8D1 HS]|uniref:penicillin-binding transpeptidase domain-containing protein n=1 Tax=Siminovitchia sp. 179-K 8D1 HS TaxID=3142385 RepID=UPI0039A373CF